jgi:hypothetical protein
MRRTIVCAAMLACASCSPLPPDDLGMGGTPGQVGGASGGGGGPKMGPDLVVSGQWTNVTGNLAGLSSDCSTVTLVSQKPDEDMLIVGVAGRGLYASVNGSPTWEELGQGAGSAPIQNRPSVIVYDPAHPTTFWESGIYNSGVFRTDDSGKTFIKLRDVEGSDTVSVDFTDPERKTLLASSHERTDRLLLSTDKGVTWTDIGPKVGNKGYTTQPIVVSSQVFLLATDQQGDDGIWRSADGGSTWARVYDIGFRTRVLTVGDTMYMGMEGRRGLIASKDQGLTWTVRGGGDILPENGRAAGLEALPDGRLVSINKEYVILSADGGVTWRRITPKLPFEPWGFHYSARRKAFYVFYFSCDMPYLIPADILQRLEFDYTKQ